ncbi:MAG TPA: TrmH family RNA methyltransferase [Limnochordales bacterium]
MEYPPPPDEPEVEPSGTAPVLDNVAVVLYQPEDIVNVGSVVRVMTNFGLRQLRLVEPAAFDPYRIEGIAHKGAPVIAATRRYPSLELALADCSLVLATTGRPRHAVRARLAPRQAAPILLQAARANPGAPAAVLFGRERDGLPSWAVDQCHGIITIPTDPANHSLNLSHAAAVVLYELYLAYLESLQAQAWQSWLAGGRVLARGQEREQMFLALADLLEALFPRTPFGRRMSALARLRAILLRAAPGPDEVSLLTRLFRHLARVARSQRTTGAHAALLPQAMPPPEPTGPDDRDTAAPAATPSPEGPGPATGSTAGE